jgi:sucrose-6-phosphate hydrolase SacC (GH32 family)
MHWGHAIKYGSYNLDRETRHPDEKDIFSGSAVVDVKSTSGWNLKNPNGMFYLS